MKFHKMKWVHWTDSFGTKDVSLGIHICWKGRIDIHFLFGMLSIGRVPIYKDRKGILFAASNSWHSDQSGKFRIRAGVP